MTVCDAQNRCSCSMRLMAEVDVTRTRYVTFHRPITVMNKIRKRQKEQAIAAELGNRMIAFTN